MRGGKPVAKGRERSLLWAVRFFLVLAAAVFGAGIVIPIAFRLGGWARGGLVDFLMFSARVDEVVLGRAPADIVAAEPGVIEAQLFYIDLSSTLLLASGVMVGFITWFGLRAGHRWAWWAMLVSFGAAAASMARAMMPYVLQAPFGFADVPPILWVLVVAPIPLVLGWRGTKDT
jgi:hypothetical protein